MNNQNNTPNTTQANTNQYDLNIENSRTLNAQTGTNINQNPYINQNLNPLQTPQPMQTTNQNGFLNGDFVKGALIGAAVTYLLTNKKRRGVKNGFTIYIRTCYWCWCSCCF